ncbi:MAG: hypothetical protein COZ06_31080 [Armatimonadetes bacterium CG_4_10_14_3_um_filter_66_18]|nr:MAG: hypothetical protein AUJ96_07560 [Armatimonadetes bacterium CG2_30_66_41]PIX43405.1 MAG: hypothetical protein COZ57_19325 [Armatimonadetes bacterium CG_4_8_14_3_um_filter_66_20]PIY38515.1 MAG: hypothetical protein COZ06_31080 [Armatimonadetes bacterium CG_4_10_14_3_um_filter_66_18]PIZ40223.1 MAG: hypothetical protein COY42_21685 [Armatimonadetes bacterium CG_4_10_14_0_8_um_filter_66_14]PJB60822.1 MAG: hypothetical protein CO096_32005 [Armatimonadetes bacterium CG_4_9_14_3_um_filter_66_1
MHPFVQSVVTIKDRFTTFAAGSLPPWVAALATFAAVVAVHLVVARIRVRRAGDWRAIHETRVEVEDKQPPPAPRAGHRPSRDPLSRRLFAL